MPSRGLLRLNWACRNIHTHKLPHLVSASLRRIWDGKHSSAAGQSHLSLFCRSPCNRPCVVASEQGDRPTSGKYGTDPGLKASCLVGASVCCNHSINILSRVPTRGMSVPRVTVLREAQSWGFLSGVYSAPSLDAVYQLEVSSTLCNGSSNIFDALFFIRLPGEPRLES